MCLQKAHQENQKEMAVKRLRQYINERITGTNYCGPGTSTSKKAKSDFDEACRIHDNQYGLLQHPYTQYNAADEQFLRSLPTARTNGIRQRLAKGAADVVFNFKRSAFQAGLIAMEENPAKKSKLKQSGMVVSLKTKLANLLKASKKKYAKKPAAKKASARSRINKSLRKGKKKTGKKKSGLPKTIKGLATALKKEEIRKLPAIKDFYTGYGVVLCAANKMTYNCPIVTELYTQADVTRARNLVNHNSTDYYGVNISKFVLDGIITNLSNGLVEVSVFTLTLKKKSVESITYNHPINDYFDSDAVDQPAAANSTTLADQLENFDMSQQLTDSGGSSTTYWSGGQYRVDTVIPIETTPKIQKFFAYKSIARSVLDPSGTMTFSVNAGSRYYKPGVDAADGSAGNVGLKPVIYTVFRVRTLQALNTTAMEPTYEIGNPAALCGVVWNKKIEYKPTLNVGTLQRPIQYITNNRSSSTAFDMFTEVASAVADTQP